MKRKGKINILENWLLPKNQILMGTISVEKIQAAFEEIRKDNKKEGEPDAPAVADLSARELQIIQARCSTHMQDHAPVHDIICDVIECRPSREEIMVSLLSDAEGVTFFARDLLYRSGGFCISWWHKSDIMQAFDEMQKDGEFEDAEPLTEQEHEQIKSDCQQHWMKYDEFDGGDLRNILSSVIESREGQES